MRFFILFCVCILAFSSIAIAYPQDQLKDCISTSLKNPAIDGVSQDSVEKYCDCALKLIVDEGGKLRDSGYECALKSFG